MDNDYKILSKSDIAFRIAFGLGVLITIGLCIVYGLVILFS